MSKVTYERFYLETQFWRVGVLGHPGREQGNRQEGMVLEQQWRVHVLIHNTDGGVLGFVLLL